MRLRRNQRDYGSSLIRAYGDQLGTIVRRRHSEAALLAARQNAERAAETARQAKIGAEQANAGLEFLFGVPVNDVSKVLLISGITAVALVSVLAGLEVGGALGP